MKILVLVCNNYFTVPPTGKIKHSEWACPDIGTPLGQ